jgi:hypothetical protein
LPGTAPIWVFTSTIVKSASNQPTEMTVLRSTNNYEAIKQANEICILKKKELNMQRKQQEEEEK